MLTLVVLEGSRLRQILETNNVEEVTKQLNELINRAKTIIVVLRCERCEVCGK